MKKVLSLVVSGLLVGSLMVGCSSVEKDADNAEYPVKQEQKKEEVKKEQSDKDKENKTNTKKQDTKDNNTTNHICPNCNSKMVELSADNYYCINPNCVSYTDPNEFNTSYAEKYKNNGNYDNKDELPDGGYYTTCPNGHKIYTVNGDYDCSKCQEEYEEAEQESSDVDNAEEYSQEADDTDNADDDYIDIYNNYWHGEYEEGSDEYNDAHNKLYGDDTENTTE